MWAWLSDRVVRSRRCGGPISLEVPGTSPFDPSAILGPDGEVRDPHEDHSGISLYQATPLSEPDFAKKKSEADALPSTVVGVSQPREPLDRIAEWMGVSSPTVRWLRTRIRLLLFDPSFRRLRWILLTGLVIRLCLAPISSWSTDTTGFTQGELAFVYLGNPYSSEALFNPPLAAFLQAPLFYFLLQFVPAQSLLVFHASLLPASSAIGPGFITPWVSSPLALLALKLPLICADSLATLVLVLLVQRSYPARSNAFAAAYFLNPLVIYVSSVHAEPDGLAALFVLLFVAGIVFDRPFLSGMFLALAVFSKAYPVILLPMAIGWSLLGSTGARSAKVVRWGHVVRLLVGAAVPFLIFLPYGQFIPAAFERVTPVGNFGGISILTLYNSGSPPLGGFRAMWDSLIPGGAIILLLSGIAAVSVAIGIALVVTRPNSTDSAVTSRPSVERVTLAVLLTIGGLLLAYPAPQPENMVAVIPLLLLTVPFLARRSIAAGLFWAVSLSGFGLYLVYGTPLEGFSPLFLLLGPDWVSGASSVMIRYGQGGYGMPPSYYWFVPGLLGGTALLMVWVIAASHVRLVDLKEGARRVMGRA